MKLDLRNLLAGEYDTLPVSFTLLPEGIDDPRSSLYRVVFPEPLAVNGEIVNNAGYMRMTLHLTISYVAPCSRCLEDVNGNYKFDIERTVVPSGMLTNISEEEADDYAVIHDGFLDMDEELLELLELTFPQKILCSETCKGLCSRCGKNLNEGPCNCDTHEIDPRLAGLKALYEKLKAEEDAEKDK